MILDKVNVEKGDLEALEKVNSVDYRVPDKLPKEVFRAYDIRGLVDAEHITPDLAYAIGLAVGTQAKNLGQTAIVVGRDGRLSGPDLHPALCQGLLSTGINIVDIGIVPTPLVYYATFRYQISSGIMITASHNPGNHNGFKIILDGKTLISSGVTSIFNQIQKGDFASGSGQRTVLSCVIDDYIQYITQRVKFRKKLKIVVDCGNGVTGLVAPALYRALGCEVTELFTELDGHFPNHHPDPLVPENLTDLSERVKLEKADLGLAFDGDGDRLGIVTDQGVIIWPDRQLMLFAKYVLAKHPGAMIIFDVKCSRLLPGLIKQWGGDSVMWRTGHSIIKSKMLEMGALLAGEMSGHIFFKDEWFGFDDGLYVGVRLLQILADSGLSVTELFAQLPNSINTPELKLWMDEDKKIPFMERLLNEADFGPHARKITIDGLRVEWDYGWGLARSSNTSSYITMRFEADDLENLEKVKALFREQLLKLDSHLKLPF